MEGVIGAKDFLYKGNEMTGKRHKGFFLVSGSAGRIGSAVRRRLLSTNNQVVGLDVSMDSGPWPETDKGALTVLGSVSNPSDVERAVALGESEYGRLLGSVHCAYPRSDGWGQAFEELTIDSLSEDFRNQLGGTIIFSQVTSAAMRPHSEGSIVLLASIQGIRAPKFHHYEGLDMTSPPTYSAIKGGVISYSRWLAKYLSGTGIRVNCVSPGGIAAEQPEVFRQRYQKDCLTKGLLDADDVVGAISFLLSDDSRYISGQNIVVDDGWSL